jgi:hypothetical protein
MSKVLRYIYLSSECKRSRNRRLAQARMGGENLLFVFSGCQFIQDLLDSDPGSSHNRLAHHDIGVRFNQRFIHSSPRCHYTQATICLCNPETGIVLAYNLILAQEQKRSSSAGVPDAKQVRTIVPELRPGNTSA